MADGSKQIEQASPSSSSVAHVNSIFSPRRNPELQERLAEGKIEEFHPFDGNNNNNDDDRVIDLPATSLLDDYQRLNHDSIDQQIDIKPSIFSPQRNPMKDAFARQENDFRLFAENHRQDDDDNDEEMDLAESSLLDNFRHRQPAPNHVTDVKPQNGFRLRSTLEANDDGRLPECHMLDSSGQLEDSTVPHLDVKPSVFSPRYHSATTMRASTECEFDPFEGETAYNNSNNDHDNSNDYDGDEDETLLLESSLLDDFKHRQAPLRVKPSAFSPRRWDSLTAKLMAEEEELQRYHEEEMYRGSEQQRIET